MKTRDKSKKMINIAKILISVSLCISFVFQPSIYVSGKDQNYNIYYETGNGDKVYSFTELLSQYEKSSTTYKRNILEYQIQALNGTISAENHANIKSQHLNVLEAIEELKQTKATLIAYKEYLEDQDNSAITGSAISIEENESLIKEVDKQIENIDIQLAQYNSSSYSLEQSLSDAQLSEDIADFFMHYQGIITEEAKKKLENDFLKRCYGLIIYQEQLDYSKAYKDYFNLIKEVDTIRYKFGLVTLMELDIDNANILQNEQLIADNQGLYDTTIKSIKKDTGITTDLKLRLSFIDTPIEYNLEATIDEFPLITE